MVLLKADDFNILILLTIIQKHVDYKIVFQHNMRNGEEIQKNYNTKLYIL